MVYEVFMGDIPSISELGYENAQLKKQLAASEAKQKAILVERDFWVEQGRSLQNALQTSQRMYADLFDQLGRGVVTEDSVADNLALASEHLCQPLTTVEAIRALTSSMKETSQGAYTMRHTGEPMGGINKPKYGDWEHD